MFSRPTHPLHVTALAMVAVTIVFAVMGSVRAGQTTRASDSSAPIPVAAPANQGGSLPTASEPQGDIASLVAARTGAAPAAPAADVPAAGAAAVIETAPAPAPEVPAPVAVQQRGGVACASPHQTAAVTRDLPVRATPGGRVIGTMPARSKYLRQPTQAWVQAVSADGRWGRVTLPWTRAVRAAGWIPLQGLARGSVRTMVVADLSTRTLQVYRGCTSILTTRTAIGRPGSPSPVGRFWVSDRVAVPSAQRASFGTYAFGMSTIQPRTPRGWTGGNQMAIHGTGAPGSIGAAASAGCLRVGEDALTRLRRMVPVGTPVIVQA